MEKEKPRQVRHIVARDIPLMVSLLQSNKAPLRKPELPNMERFEVRLESLKQEILDLQKVIKECDDRYKEHPTTKRIIEIDADLATAQSYFNKVDNFTKETRAFADFLHKEAEALSLEAIRLSKLASEYKEDCDWCKITIKEEIPIEDLEKEKKTLEQERLKSLSRVKRERYVATSRIEKIKRKIMLCKKDAMQTINKYQESLDKYNNS